MFAEERSFDPLLADNWYNTPADSVVSAKVCKKIVRERGMEQKGEMEVSRERWGVGREKC